MITTVIRGGLGNQLFQYASAYALAKRLDQPLTLDISFFPKQTLRGYKLDNLRLAEHIVTYGEDDGILKKTYKNRYINGFIRRSNVKMLPIRNGKYLVDHAGSYTPDFFTIADRNIFMNGYFQSEKYFYSFRSDLLKQLQPGYPPEAGYTNVLKDIQNVNAVAVHVRHGDFTCSSGDSYHYVLGVGYYERAIQIVREIIESPVFFCFSDDIEWVEQNIGGTDDFHFISLSTLHADVDELMLMKKCKHIITANSTFSWWAAWLNENPKAIRIVPERAYGNDQMIPASWIKVGVE